jgi:hypothetical protein
MGKKNPIKLEDEKGLRSTSIRIIDVDFFFKEKENFLWNLKMQEIRARDKHFGANMGIIGSVEFNRDQVGNDLRKQYLAVDLDRWNLTGDNTINSRLVVRSFQDVIKNESTGTRTGGSYQGGLEMSMLNSLMLSMAARRPLASMYLLLPDFREMTQIFQQRTVIGHHYIFPLYPVLDEPVRFFEIIGTIGVGEDFKVIEIGRKGIIAKIDEKIMNLGGRFEVEIYDPYLQRHQTFPQLMILLCAFAKFLNPIEKMIETLLSSVFHDKIDEIGYRFNAHPEDLELLRNPRFKK